MSVKCTDGDLRSILTIPGTVEVAYLRTQYRYRT
jgi:hypothetical protein